MSNIDEWDDAGAFLYRNLPESCLDAFFHEERDMIRISRDLGKWWIAEDGVSGQSPHDTLQQAKEAGDAIVEKAESTLDAKLFEEAGLSPEDWRLVHGDGIRFEEIAGDRWIDGDTQGGMADRQSWDAMKGDTIVSKGHASVRDALATYDMMAV